MSGAPPRGQKRGPSVLVTDTRETRPALRPANSSALPRGNRTPGGNPGGTRLISVDNVLQYASEIPSAQRREPSGGGPRRGEGVRHHNRTPSGRHPLDPKLSGKGVPVSQLGMAAHLPARSSKTSEKLVLLPETGEEDEAEAEEQEDEEEDEGPPRDEDIRKRKEKGARGKTDAERLPKSQRTAEAQLARVTAYCTAQSFKLRSTAQFVRDQHAARTKLYDDCLYCVYQLPLLGGSEGYRMRSSPVVKNPGGRSVLDEQIEANEQRQYREGWMGESDEYSVRGNEGWRETPPEDAMEDAKRERGWAGVEQEERGHEEHERRESTDSSTLSVASPHSGSTQTVAPDAYQVAELFIFSYGVAVLWNFTPNQEKDLLADLTFSSSAHHNNSTKPSASANPLISQKAAALAPPSALPLMTRPLDEDDFETEEFHFQYDATIEKPRIYNDMITLRTSDHMIKLGMSHAVGQSTKLSFFEERMQRTMAEAQYVPRRLALEGRLGMTRKEVVGLVGRLFEGRVDVNLSSNMLDTPTFFWDSEPTLHPLYAAVREYLEIKPRIQVLNERCRVFLDLAEILSDSIADVKMTRITWIVIILIMISILVTCTEVVLRFALLAAGRGKDEKGGEVGGNFLGGTGSL